VRSKAGIFRSNSANGTGRILILALGVNGSEHANLAYVVVDLGEVDFA
jgi:hypothetical protein